MRVTVCQIRGWWEQLEWVAGVLFYDIVGTFFFFCQKMDSKITVGK